MATKVAVSGALGRMGSGIIRKVHQQDDMEVACAIEMAGREEIGRDIGELLGIGNIGVPLAGSDTLRETLESAGAEVLVDFTAAGPAMETIETAASLGVDLVVGTTGFSQEERAKIEGWVKDNSVSAVISPNMATGVNVFFKIARDVARVMGEETDIEIIEAHHHHKKDAPSGTAVRVGELIAEALGRNIEEDGVFGRPRGVIGERSRKEIGFHAVRAGDIVGEHTVIFAGDGERFEITHRAHSRDCFVSGTVKAIRFVARNRGQGRVFTTWDVLGSEGGY
ncbi:MAG: 4-hydroxy-tetrahydrodipicolinate reductase [Euryarchaeota archaeon]|nr:4-hydroxy-tetrahydrodipicolinate reductase [Euryarchaeota archaeon]